jgi:hypothetical protein
MMERFDPAYSCVLIYAFAIFDEKHMGCLKIGKATIKLKDEQEYGSLFIPNTSLLNRAAKERIDSYTKTAGITYTLLHTELAIREIKEGGRGYLKYFGDHDVHNVLKNSGIKMISFDGSKEWFKTDIESVKNAIRAVKEGRTSLTGAEISSDRIPISFRPEQCEAIQMTTKRFERHNRMLWNAKMRFGKTLSTLEVIKRKKFKKTIILTHRPVVDNSWEEDFYKIFYGDSEYYYCKKGTEESVILKHIKKDEPFIFFASIQNLRGSDVVGGRFDKNSMIFSTKWDLVVVDEAHEGTKTTLGDDVLKEIIKEDTYGKTKQIYLSGTPFNLVEDFEEEEVYTWDYVMEQKAKNEWDILKGLDSNPYEGLPKLSIYTYDIANAIPGYEDIQERAFNFREFFRVWTGLVENDGRKIPDASSAGRFVHESDVKSFLNLLVKKDEDSNYPYSRDEYREYFNHTLWMLPGVKEAKALKALLENHEIFGLFNIINVAGSDTEEIPDALERVQNAITEHPEQTRTITLSCGRLTTGVTVRPWTAVLMLSGSNTTSASAYLQTIFRVQTPANINGRIKDRCFVFDFAPDRTLQMVAEAGKLAARPGRYNLASEEKMSEFLNFCPVIAIHGSEMIYYDVDSMLRQLKRYYAARVAQNGFDDIKLYNDKLLKLTTLDKKKFEDLKKVVGATKASDIKREIIISESGLGAEEQQAAEDAERKRKKGRDPLSPEEKEILRKLREAREEKSKAISILRAISIRIPLLVYGAEKDIEENITIDNFSSMIDDESWKEFMPQGVTKEKFNEFIEYYDKDIFIEAGNQIRRKVKAADDLKPTERVRKLSEIFATFKNPDKETVLTPWRVVNMHMGDCIGGYVYLNDNYTEVLDEPRFVDHGEVTTQTLTNINAKILEINSKSGLYPLYVAYSIYRKRISNYSDEEKTKKIQEELWHQTLRENIYVICKTEMAKLITKRTLLGYKAGKINAHYFEDLVNQFKNKTSHVIKKITTKGTWHKGEIGYMKFDAIVGNPPYQVMDGGGNGVGATSIYQLFVQTAKKMNSAIISMITPSRWFSGGKGLNEFRDEMLNDKRLKCIVDFQDSRDCFPNVDIAGGVSYFLIDRINHSHCLIRHYESGHWDESSRVLNDFPILIRDSVSYSIICKIKKTSKFMNEVVSSRKPFGIESSEPLIERGEYLYFCKDGWGMIDKRKVLRGFNLISKNKVVISKTASEHAGQKDSFGKKKVLSKIEIMPQNSVCSETYLVVFASDNDEEVQNVKNYLSTKFVRFLLSCVASTQNLTKESFMFVPVQDFSKSFSDQELFRKYDLSQEEISFIENMIKPMA